MLGELGIGGMTRQAFLLRSAVATGAAFGAGAAGPRVLAALATPAGDAAVLRFALTLELLTADLYGRALAEVPGLTPSERELVTTLRDHERAHAEALKGALRDLGEDPGAAPSFDFGNALSSRASFFALAQEIEDLSVAAYNGAAPRIDSEDLLEAAGGIVQVEARHAAAVRIARGRPITDVAFDNGALEPAVLAAAAPFIQKP